MIGDVRLRSRPRMSAAVSKPSIPGIWTSSRIDREVAAQRSSRSASSPESAVTQRAPERLEHGLEREEVLRAVVDEQDPRAVDGRR